jgi:DNA mismatch endonuclease, patch repair protein
METRRGPRDPWPGVPAARRRIMAANRRRDTSPELLLRSALHRSGLRFRVDFPIPVPSRRPIRPDVVFTRCRLAVFLDGCFWHGCPVHGAPPRSNLSYWLPKIAATRARDARADQLLQEAGWTVVRIWEHDPVGAAVERVGEALAKVRAVPELP